MLKELGARLHTERRRRGLKQADLARAASVARPAVSAAEAGRGVSSQSMAVLVAALGLDFARLPMPDRPLFKDLIREERERQARLRSQRKSASFARTSRPAESDVRTGTIRLGTLPVTARRDSGHPPTRRRTCLQSLDRLDVIPPDVIHPAVLHVGERACAEAEWLDDRTLHARQARKHCSGAPEHYLRKLVAASRHRTPHRAFSAHRGPFVARTPAEHTTAANRTVPSQSAKDPAGRRRRRRAKMPTTMIPPPKRANVEGSGSPGISSAVT